MNNTTQAVLDEVGKVILGKRTVLTKVLTAILADGHILLDDVPGVGKTTMALAVSRALGLQYNRIQFTPDVLPSDIVGFSMYDRQTGALRYVPGVVNGTNLLLGDEINRTSSKTQSALLEAMEERQITVDGTRHPLETPFLVMATQNQVGTAGTQLLPYAQLDRFLVRLRVGYPDFESQMEMIRDRQTADPLDTVQQLTTRETLVKMQTEAAAVHLSDEVLAYIVRLTTATREHRDVALGVSPRGAIFISRMARAYAYVCGRDYVLPEDVREIFADVCAHRILLAPDAAGDVETLLESLLETVPLPNRPGK